MGYPIPYQGIERVLPLLNQRMGTPYQSTFETNLRRIEPFASIKLDWFGFRKPDRMSAEGVSQASVTLRVDPLITK